MEGSLVYCFNISLYSSDTLSTKGRKLRFDSISSFSLIFTLIKIKKKKKKKKNEAASLQLLAKYPQLPAILIG